MIEKVTKTVELHLLELSNAKAEALSELYKSYLVGANIILDELKAREYTSKYQLQTATYNQVRALGLHSQQVVDVVKDVWIQRKKVKRIEGFNRLGIRYNIPRSASFKKTKRGNPILSLAILGGRTHIPICQDKGYERFQSLIGDDYSFTELQLLRKGNGWVVHAVMKKAFEATNGTNVLGIDVGTNTLAAITVCDPLHRKVLKQLYFGRDMYQVKRDIGIRRSKLQSKNTEKAAIALKKLRGYEHNFTKTRCFEIAHQIVVLATEYNCTIAIENLKHLNKSKLSRKSNRKVKRMPYAMFVAALQAVAFQSGIAIVKVDPRYTSKTCSKCGERGSRTGAIFKCTCGFISNSDRNASCNIALRAVKADTPKTLDQYPQGRMPVSASLRVDENERL